MESIGDRIRCFRENLSLTQEALAQKLNTTKQTIYKYENDIITNIPSDKIELLSKIFNVSPAVLMGWDTKSSATNDDLPSNAILPSARSLPIMGTICAGDGVVCVDDYQGHFIIDVDVQADYCLRVHGDSMVGANIFDEDIVFISKDFDFESGEIYAIENTNIKEASLKRVYRDNDTIILSSCNPEYNALTVSDDSQIRIVGRCVGVYHKY